MGSISAYDSDEDQTTTSNFNMKTKLKELFGEDIPENQQGLDEYKDLIFD